MATAKKSRNRKTAAKKKTVSAATRRRMSAAQKARHVALRAVEENITRSKQHTGRTFHATEPRVNPDEVHTVGAGGRELRTAAGLKAIEREQRAIGAITKALKDLPTLDAQQRVLRYVMSHFNMHT